MTEFLTGIVRRGAGLPSPAGARPRREPVFPLGPVRSDARATAATAADVREEAVEPPWARSAVTASADAAGPRATPAEGRIVAAAAADVLAAPAPPHEAATPAVVAVATAPAGPQHAVPRVEPPDLVTVAPDRLASTVGPAATPSEAWFADAGGPSLAQAEPVVGLIGSDESEPVTLAPVPPPAEALDRLPHERAGPSPTEAAGPRPHHASAVVPRPPVAEERAQGRPVVVPERPRVEVTIGHVDVRGVEQADVPAPANSFAGDTAARRYLDRRWY